jgi:hypothetical protein
LKLKINKIEKSLAKLTKRRKEKTQINKIRDEKGNITTDTNEIQMILQEYFKNPCFYKLENEEEIDKFLDTHDLSKLNQEVNTNLSSSIISNEIETVIKKLPTKKPSP